jgi:peptidyl-prolyl cis-trans isomerase SurA
MTRRLVLALLALGFLAVSCASISVAAATVNGHKISEAEVEGAFDRVRTDPTFQDLLTQQADQVRGFTRRRILTALIRQEVLNQEAHRAGVEVSEEQVTRLIADEAARQGLGVEEFLEAVNLTEAAAREAAGNVILEFELRDHVTRDVEVGRREVREVYEDNIGAFEEVQLRRLTVDTEEQAREAIAEVEGGAAFASVAERRSTDELASEGGAMGFVSVADLGGLLQAAIDDTTVRGLTDPVPSAAGFQVYQVLDRRTQPLGDVEGLITAQLLNEARAERFEAWVAERVRVADIVVNPKYGTFDARSLEVVQREPAE